MSAGILLTIASFLYTILLCIVYFYKIRLQTIENKLFRRIMFVTLIGLFLHLYLFGLMKYFGTTSELTILISKMYLIYLLIWISLFTIYVFAISIKNSEKLLINLKKVLFVVYLIVGIISIIIFIEPIKFVNEAGKMYTYGPAVDIVYVFSTILVFINIICLIINFKKIMQKKYIPVLSYFVLLAVVMFFQYNRPWLQLMTSLTGFIVYLLYFTIENPDIKLIKELTYSKQLLQRKNNATMDSLNKLSENISSSLGELFLFGNKKINSNNADELKEELKNTQKMSLSLVDRINDIIDLSRVESDEFNINNYNYDSSEMLDKINSLFKTKIGNNKLFFNIKNKLPDILYGDESKIEQTLLYMLNVIIYLCGDNNISYEISSMRVGSLCRLKFVFEVNYNKLKDIDIDKIDTLDYQILMNLISLQRGRYYTKIIDDSFLNFIITIDQKIIEVPQVAVKEDNDNNTDIFDATGKRVLIVDDNRKKIKELVKLLQVYNISVGVAHNREEYKNALQKNKTWDLILLDDMMPDSSRFEYFNDEYLEKKNLLRRIELISGYEIKVVVLLTIGNKLEKKYITEGIDYIIKPINKNSLNKILIKYLKK